MDKIYYKMEKHRVYSFYKNIANPEFSIESIVPIPDNRPIKESSEKSEPQNEPFDSCLIRNNSEKGSNVDESLNYKKIKYGINNSRRKSNHLLSICENLKSEGHYGEENKNSSLIFVKTIPSSYTLLQVHEVDKNTGEMNLLTEPYKTNEIKAANNRKKKALNKFCDFYEPLYKEKKVTILFMTFTRLNQSRILFSDLLDNIKYHLEEQLHRPIRGYFWTLEVSDKFHLHYHLCIAIDRLNVKKIPKELKFEKLWGQRTQVEFIKKSIRGYLSKYLAKDSYRIIGLRSYGKSSKYK